MSECLSIKFVYYTLMTAALNRFFNVVSVFWTPLYIAMLMQHFKSYEIHTDHMKKNIYEKKRTNDLQNSKGVPQMGVQEDIPTETACTNRAHSNRKNSQPSERNFPLSLYH